MLTAMMEGAVGVQNYGKHADIILERSLIKDSRMKAKNQKKHNVM